MRFSFSKTTDLYDGGSETGLCSKMGEGPEYSNTGEKCLVRNIKHIQEKAHCDRMEIHGDIHRNS